MGQVILLVVAAAWAAVLVPPLLRSRVENRPNSSVSDFRSQLSSLQRAMPSRGVAVRTMGRPLAPSTLSRPAASGRPVLRSGLGANHAAATRSAAQPPPSRQSAREASRMQEASLRPRRHGDRTNGVARPQQRTSRAPDQAELKRRRTKVLYLLAATSACSGFLAATTDSKPMVYVFAVAMIALGGYVYMLAMINQRDTMAAPLYADDFERDMYETPAIRGQSQFASRFDETMPAPRESYRYDNDRDGYGENIRYERRDQSDRDDTPGMGVSGRISYGRGPAGRQPQSQSSRYGGDAYGFETYDRSEPVRRPPARNGRHATGQHPAVQRPREAQPVRRGYFPQAG